MCKMTKCVDHDQMPQIVNLIRGGTVCLKDIIKFIQYKLETIKLCNKISIFFFISKLMENTFSGRAELKTHNIALYAATKRGW